MKVKHENLVISFENGARKKGYSFQRDEIGNYVDHYLQESWEIFCLISIDDLILEAF